MQRHAAALPLLLGCPVCVCVCVCVMTSNGTRTTSYSPHFPQVQALPYLSSMCYSNQHNSVCKPLQHTSLAHKSRHFHHPDSTHQSAPSPQQGVLLQPAQLCVQTPATHLPSTQAGRYVHHPSAPLPQQRVVLQPAHFPVEALEQVAFGLARHTALCTITHSDFHDERHVLR